MTIAVLGATGGQGGAVVRALVETGQTVRAVVRNPSSPRVAPLLSAGVDVVRGDLADAASLAEAFRGASAAYAVTTPFEDGPDTEVAQGQAIIEAADRASLPHLILASVASADRETGIPHFESKGRIERTLAETGLPSTVVAPTYFFENALGALSEVADGIMAFALPAHKPLQQVARRDLGRVVAAIIADRDRWIGERVEVAGDDPTPTQMTQAVTEAANGLVSFRQIPLQELREANPDMAAMFTFLSGTGYQVDLEKLRMEFPGIAWLSFSDWAARQTWPVPRT